MRAYVDTQEQFDNLILVIGIITVIYLYWWSIMADRMDVSDKTAISMPMRNLLSILAAVGIGVYAFFGIQERLNNVETRSTLMEADLTARIQNLE